MKRLICAVCLTVVLMLGVLGECMGKTANGQQPPFWTWEIRKKSVDYTELREAEDVSVTVLKDENGQYHVSIPERTKSEENINAWLSDFYEEDAKKYEDFMGIGIEESEWYLTEKERKEMGFSYSTSLHVKRMDDAAISFQGSTYTYSGGAHGNSDHFGVNFDARSGSIIELSDIFFDMEDFYIFANDYIEQNYSEYVWDWTWIVEHEGESMSWYMEGYGINFLYDGSNWHWQYRIPYEYLVDYMKPEYFPTSREAEYSFYMKVDAIMDVNGDGVMDVVTRPVKNGDIWEISINKTVSELSRDWHDIYDEHEVGSEGSFKLVRDEEGVTRLRWRVDSNKHLNGDFYRIDGEFVITYRIDGENVVFEDIVKIPRSY